MPATRLVYGPVARANGVVRGLRLLGPICDESLAPQQYAAPAPVSAHVWPHPPTRLATGKGSGGITGTGAGVSLHDAIAATVDAAMIARRNSARVTATSLRTWPAPRPSTAAQTRGRS